MGLPEGSVGSGGGNGLPNASVGMACGAIGLPEGSVGTGGGNGLPNASVGAAGGAIGLPKESVGNGVGSTIGLPNASVGTADTLLGSSVGTTPGAPGVGVTFGPYPQRSCTSPRLPSEVCSMRRKQYAAPGSTPVVTGKLYCAGVDGLPLAGMKPMR